MLQEHSSPSTFRLAGIFPTAPSFGTLKFSSYCLTLPRIAFANINKEFSVAFSESWIKSQRTHAADCLGFSKKEPIVNAMIELTMGQCLDLLALTICLHL